MPKNIDKDKMNKKSKDKKLDSFAEKFRKGFSGGKDSKKPKMKTETSGQKLMKFFKGK